MNKVSYYIVLNDKYINKYGLCPVYLRVNINAIKKEFNTGVYIPPSYWDYNLKKIKNGYTDSQKLNSIIFDYLFKINQFVIDCSLKNFNIELNDIIDLFEKNRTTPRDKSSFTDYIEKVVEKHKSMIALSTYRQYKSELSKLKKFKENILFHEINHNFLIDYEIYMRNVLNNQQNTLNKTLKKIKILIGFAMKDDKLKSNPFDKYKMPSYIIPDRTALNIEEIEKIEEIYFNPNVNEKIRNVLRYFLFCCYTGIRFCDIVNLCYENISNDIITIKQQKTNRNLIVPLSKKAKQYLVTDEIGKVFRTITIQKTNEYLKLALTTANIKKKVTFHCSRHTFATCSITLGIPYEVVSKLLGHTDLKTTQIYAKIVDEVKIKEIDKWNF